MTGSNTGQANKANNKHIQQRSFMSQMFDEHFENPLLKWGEVATMGAIIGGLQSSLIYHEWSLQVFLWMAMPEWSQPAIEPGYASRNGKGVILADSPLICFRPV